MASSSVTRELSMDEILQKIERSMIDEQKPEAPNTAPQSAEVVDLTDADRENDRAGDTDAGEERSAPKRRMAASPVEASSPQEAVNDEGGERLPSDAAAERAADVQQLAGDQPKRKRPLEPVMAGAHTLEDVMRELLRPQLQGWLDAKLPAIIERQVRAELARTFSEAARS